MKPAPIRARRWIVRAAVVVFATYALYLVAANAFLRTDLARDLVNRRPERFHMQWSGGHTLWPGRVALREVRIGGQARRTRWWLEAGQARGRIALWPLLAREIRVPWVEADGVRGGVDRVDEARSLPPASARAGKPWTLSMPRIASDSVQGGDVFGWTIAGHGRAEVGFRKELGGGAVELLPSSAAFDALAASRAGETWLRDGRLAATFALPRHLPSQVPGLRKLELLAATLELQGRTDGVRYRLGDDDRYHFAATPGEGRVEAVLSLAQGALARGDRLRLAVPLHATGGDGVEHHDTFEAALDVDEALAVRLLLPDSGARGVSLDTALRVPGTALPLDDWRARIAQAHGHVRGELRVPSIGALLALFAHADWLQLEGRGQVEADLALAGGHLAPGSRLRVRDVDARADVLGNRFSGRAEADAAIDAADDGTPRSRVDVRMQQFAAAPATDLAAPWLAGEELRVELESEAQLERMRETLQARLRFRQARVPDLTVLNAWLPNDRLRIVAGSGWLSGDLQVDGEGEVGVGSLRADAPAARLQVDGIDLRGDVELDGRLRRGDLQRGRFALGGTQLRLRNVAFRERGGSARSGWWATLDLDDGHVDWQRPSTLGGRLRARMKDVGFLLALFADRASYPSWTGRVVDAGEARVDGRWLWSGNALVLDRVRARNDRFQVDARMRMQGRQRQGDLYLKWGVLGLGVELQGQQRQFHLRNARAWYDGRPHLL